MPDQTNSRDAFVQKAKDWPFKEIAQRLNRVTKNGSEWQGPCPRCGGKDRYSVNLQKPAFNCRGCNAKGRDALGLVAHEMDFDLEDGIDFMNACAYITHDPIPAYDGSNQAPRNNDGFADMPDFFDPKPVAVFDYHDERGKLAYQVVKFPKSAQRRYMQRRPFKGGWVWGLQEGEYARTKDKHWWKAKEDKQYDERATLEAAARFLYRRSEVMAQKASGGTVALVEGEKDAETVRDFGLTATTNAGGAKYWQDSFDDDLAGLDVYIFPDNDEPGFNRAQIRASGLKAKGCNVFIVDVSKHWPECPPKGDISDWKDAGLTFEQFHELIKKAEVWKPAPPKSSFGAITWDRIDEEGPQLEFLVDDMLTTGDKSILAGVSGSGKSFLALDMAMSISRGTEFLGRAVQQGGVIYQAGEGARGLKKRIKAYRKYKEIPDGEDVPFVILPSKVDLFSREGDTQKLIDEVNAWKIVMPDLKLLVIDTFNRASTGADENSGKDVGQFIDSIDRLQLGCGVHVMIVHHMNANGGKVRGHTSLYADVDQVLTVIRDEETGDRTLTLSKQKDGEDGVKIRFSLAQVKIGYNPITEKDTTSCVVVTVSEKDRLKKEQERQGITVNPTERRFLMDFFEAQDKYGIFVVDQPEIPFKARGRSVIRYQEYVEVALSKMPEVGTDPEEIKKAKDTLRKKFSKMTDALRKYRVVDFDTPYMWWTGRAIKGFPNTFPKNTPDAIPAQAYSDQSDVESFISEDVGF